MPPGADASCAASRLLAGISTSRWPSLRARRAGFIETCQTCGGESRVVGGVGATVGTYLPRSGALLVTGPDGWSQAGAGSGGLGFLKARAKAVEGFPMGQEAIRSAKSSKHRKAHTSRRRASKGSGGRANALARGLGLRVGAVCLPDEPLARRQGEAAGSWPDGADPPAEVGAGASWSNSPIQEHSFVTVGHHHRAAGDRPSFGKSRSRGCTVHAVTQTWSEKRAKNA